MYGSPGNNRPKHGQTTDIVLSLESEFMVSFTISDKQSTRYPNILFWL